ncbi:MAG: flagellar brake protein [Gallionella sp.]|nr:flagellar brake protein [Gallionella sp.]
MSSDVQTNSKSEMTDLVSVGVVIGDVLQLQEISEAGHRYAVDMIGFADKQSVLVSHPMLNDLPVSIAEGDRFLVRGFSGRKTYEFEAAVIALAKTPFSHLHLTFPAQVSVIHMRNALRIRPNLGCFVQDPANPLKMPATIEDISTSGARIQSRTALGKVGDRLVLNFRLPVAGEEQSFVMPAIVRNVSEVDKVMMHGLEFEQSEGKARMALQHFIYRTMAER